MPIPRDGCTFMTQKVPEKCPCSLCLVKVICMKWCDDYIIERNRMWSKNHNRRHDEKNKRIL